jgi:hypothetical protein
MIKRHEIRPRRKRGALSIADRHADGEVHEELTEEELGAE